MALGMVYMRGRYKYFRMGAILHVKTPRMHRITRTSHALTLICLAIRLDSSLPQTGQHIVLGILPSSQAINISSVENSAPQPVQQIILPFVILKEDFRSMVHINAILERNSQV